MAIPKGPVKAGKPIKAKAIKEGQIKKKGKEANFKQTPQGKVPLIHNKKNGNSNSQQKVSNQSPQQQSKKKQLNFSNKQKDNKKSPKSPNQKQPQKKKNKITKNEEENEDSDEDINEGISMTDSMMNEDDDDDDVGSSHDETAPNIFGESLADDTDEDDDDFDADSDDEEDKPTEKKGVKMFTGMKSAKKAKAEVDDEDDNDDEDEDDDDEDNDDDDEDDDDDDDDDDENDEDEADEDISSLSENEALRRLETIGQDDDDEDEDEDEDEDDDDDDDEEEDGPGLKALIGQSLVDDDDDEDFEGEDDDDDDDEIDESDEDENHSQNNSMQSNNSSTASSPSKDEKKLSPEEKEEKDKRSIFIGNVPKDIKESRVKSEFAKFGPIESLRIRGVIPESPGMSYKVAAIKKKFHPKSTTICVFIVYKSEDSVTKALAMNGKQLEGNYLRVERINQPYEIDPKKAVFAGNLLFKTEDNEVWELFNKCGEIDYVKTLRDRVTGACRGGAYVSFKTEDAANIALELNGTKLNGREVRVVRYEPHTKKPRHQGSGQKRSMGQNRNSVSKKPKFEQNKSESEDNGSSKKQKFKKEKRSQGANQRSKKDDSFQGQTAHAKKKGNKGKKFDKKKAMAGKLLSKPKKPQQ